MAFFILVLEVLFMLLVVLIFLVTKALKVSRRKREAVAKLVSQVKEQSESRMNAAKAFLETVHHLEGNELEAAIDSIVTSEKQLLLSLIESYLADSSDLIPTMDAPVAQLADAYRGLKTNEKKALSPYEKAVEIQKKTIVDLKIKNKKYEEEGKKAKLENQKLSDELSSAHDKMDSMIDEFGNMFGGGVEHDLEEVEVVEKVSTHLDQEDGSSPENGDEPDDKTVVAT